MEKKYKYKTFYSDEDVATFINKKESEGWQFCQFLSPSMFIFRREVVDEIVNNIEQENQPVQENEIPTIDQNLLNALKEQSEQDQAREHEIERQESIKDWSKEDDFIASEVRGITVKELRMLIANAVIATPGVDMSIGALGETLNTITGLLHEKLEKKEMKDFGMTE